MKHLNTIKLIFGSVFLIYAVIVGLMIFLDTLEIVDFGNLFIQYIFKGITPATPYSLVFFGLCAIAGAMLINSITSD